MHQRLIKKAIEAQNYAYAPYSEFLVGAAVLCEDGSIYTGCNVENSSYGLTNCAERTAVFKAISEGKRKFLAIALVGNKKGEEANRDYCMPCGACRQVLGEFVSGDFKIYAAKSETDYQEFTMEELLPHSFSEKSLSFLSV